MARQARITVPGFPHHVVQRGNRRLPVFFCDQDRELYLRILMCLTKKHAVGIWAYCLMENHVHLVLVPSTAEALSRAVGETHRLYATEVNARKGWRGHLWQYRFASFVMGETYLLRAMRYIERNPVRAGLVNKAEDYPWSSAAAHIKRSRDAVLSPCPLVEELHDWGDYVNAQDAGKIQDMMRKHGRTGRPFGDNGFLEKISELTGIDIKELVDKTLGRPKSINK